MSFNSEIDDKSCIRQSSKISSSLELVSKVYNENYGKTDKKNIEKMSFNSEIDDKSCIRQSSKISSSGLTIDVSFPRPSINKIVKQIQIDRCILDQYNLKELAKRSKKSKENKELEEERIRLKEQRTSTRQQKKLKESILFEDEDEDDIFQSINRILKEISDIPDEMVSPIHIKENKQEKRELTVAEKLARSERKQQKKNVKRYRVEKRIALDLIASDKKNAKTSRSIAYNFTLIESNSVKDAALFFCNKKGVHYMLHKTDNEKWYRYAHVDDYDFKKYNLRHIKNGHYAFAIFEGDEDTGYFNVRNIPKTFVTDLENLEKNSFIPKKEESINLNNVSYACVSINIFISGKGWEIQVVGGGKARELFREECAKIDIITHGLNKNSIYDNDDISIDEEDKKLLYDNACKPFNYELSIPTSPSVKKIPNTCIGHYLQMSPVEKISNQKKKIYTLAEFHKIVKMEKRNYCSQIYCKNMEKEFGCSIKGCMFNHPEGWDSLKASKLYKASGQKEKIIKKEIVDEEYNLNIEEFPILPSSPTRSNYSDSSLNYRKCFTITDTTFNHINKQNSEKVHEHKIISIPCKYGKRCTYGKECRFVHDVDEQKSIKVQKYKTLCFPCRHGIKCTYGKECRFVHQGTKCSHGIDVCNGKKCTMCK
jgi:hypothetical protein